MILRKKESCWLAIKPQPVTDVEGEKGVNLRHAVCQGEDGACHQTGSVQ